MSKEKMKIAFLAVGMLVLMVVFGWVITLLEKNMPEETINANSFLAEDMPEQEEKEVMGSISLGGETYDYYHEFETYLLIGTDETETERTEEYQGGMADFLLLLVLDKTENTYSFLSLNRDTMTEVRLIQKDGTGEATANIQLCTAHWYGGTAEQSCENTVEAVSKLLGNAPITGYYCLPMSQIPKLNQAVGGVEVTLEEDFRHVDRQMKKGKTLPLTDDQAYHYVHDRYGIGDEENTSRMKRQRQYMKALFEKAKTQMKEEPNLIQKMNLELQESAVSNISGKQMSQIANQIMQGTQKGFCEPEGKSKIGKALGDGIDHVEFWIDESSLIHIMTMIYGVEKRGTEE